MWVLIDWLKVVVSVLVALNELLWRHDCAHTVVGFVENDENYRKDIDVFLSFQLLCRDLEANARSFKPVVMRMKIPRGCMCRPCSAGVGVKPLEIADIQDKRELWGTYAMLLS